MSLFNYRDYSQEKLHHLIGAAQDLNDAALLHVVTNLIPSSGSLIKFLGNATGGFVPRVDVDKIDAGLKADGWNKMSPSQLGLTNSSLDIFGYYTLPSTVYGNFPTGPQLEVYERKNAQGKVIGLGIVHIGTNSPMDVLDYLQMHSGDMRFSMDPFLSRVATYAKANGLTGEDVLVTGYSLGGAMVNIQAKYSETLAGGFFKDSNYIGGATPYVYDNPDKVLNLGYENDAVYRVAGDYATLGEMFTQTGLLINTLDKNYKTTTDNVVLFDAVYGLPIFPGPIAVLNLFSWAAHIYALGSNTYNRIFDSPHYSDMGNDSAVIVANLPDILRPFVWVEDKGVPSSSPDGRQAFLLGSQYNDLLRDGRGDDYVFGATGNDTIRLSHGYDVADGGAGSDTVSLSGNTNNWDAYRLSTGELFMFSKSGQGLKALTNIENIQFDDPFFGINTSHMYSIQNNRLEDERWSPFQMLDKDLAYKAAVEGTNGSDWLVGTTVFGKAGDDSIQGTTGNNLLHGGSGNDTMRGLGGSDWLYGGSGDDTMIANKGSILNGGVGSDKFVFDKASNGTAIIQDFNDARLGTDLLVFSRDLFTTSQDAKNAATQVGADTVINANNGLNLIVQNTKVNDLVLDSFKIMDTLA